LTVMVAVMVVPTVEVLVKTTVAVTVVPTWALAGRATVVLISVKRTVTVAVAVLLPIGSITPAGAVTVAVLVSKPLALAAAVTWKLTVTTPPAGIVTEPFRLVDVATKLAVLAPALT
jgi:hypothetical protein